MTSCQIEDAYTGVMPGRDSGAGHVSFQPVLTERNAQSIGAKCPRRHEELGEIWEMIKGFLPIETNRDQSI